ncbi:hypothetical protein K491DRAFT_406655 [Lophiostoma macrostomum CBS 122681]|uniref:DUF6604 domain-containing protein n=1 Tax=Lophiostoma macrostomum CBS 122681 TaxID=1314788 RepID=A0A6A6T869_9PLEO|nr:hypothetical protein K491DRAFT_406655 [Lophiostoma macrostomum CBS 122681]
MAGPLLVDSYRRYKKDTSEFLNWLCSKARSTGTVDDIFSSKPVAGRAKGRSRKKVAAPSSSPNTIQVPVRALVRLAKAIREDDRVETPIAMMVTLKDVIRLRKECARFYKYDAKADDREKNETHAYFISVLEEVHAILASRLPMTSCAENDGMEENPPGMTNIFQHLTIEDLSGSDSEDAAKPKETSPAEEDTYTLETSEADTSFAIFCLLKDVTDVRLFVRRTWRQFKDALVSLETAALVTNSAMSTIETISKEFVKAYPEFKDHDNIAPFLKEAFFDKQDIHASQAPKKFNACYESGGQTLSYPTISCDQTMETITFFVILDKELDITRTAYTASGVRFIKCLKQMKHIAFGKVEFPGNCQVHKAIRHARMTTSLPTWAVLNIQIFADTLLELEDYLEKAFTKAEQTTAWIISTLDEYLRLEGAADMGIWHKTNRKLMIGFREEIRKIFHHDFVQEALKTVPQSSAISFGDRFLLRHHPLWCGLLTQDIICQFQVFAIGMASSQGMILSSVHLYNASEQLKSSQKDNVWKDMDWIIGKHGENHLFAGPRPQFRKDFHYRSDIAFGQDPQQAPGAGKIRRLNIVSSYTQANMSIEDRTSATKAVPDRPEALLHLMCLADPSNDTAENEEPAPKRKVKGKKKKAKRNRTKTKKTNTPVELLTIFREKLKEDEFVLRFDTMRLFLGCIKVLRRIQAHVIRYAPFDYPPEQYGRGLGVNTCVSGVLWELAGYPIMHTEQFPAVDKILVDFIKEEGSVEYDRAVARVPNVNSKGDSAPEPEPSFECPVEDHVPIHTRDAIKHAIKDAGVKVIVDHAGQKREVTFDGKL